MEKSQKFELSKEDIRELRFALAELFFGLARANWVRGGKLGTARQKALRQVMSYIAAKEEKYPNNEVIKCLRSLANEYKSKVYQSIMTGHKSDARMDLPLPKLDSHAAHGAIWVGDAMDKLGNKIQGFEERRKNYKVLPPQIIFALGQHRQNAA